MQPRQIEEGDFSSYKYISTDGNRILRRKIKKKCYNFKIQAPNTMTGDLVLTTELKK